MTEFNPTEGLTEINRDDIEPGDEIFWTWPASQVKGWTYYVHAVMPVLKENATERDRQKFDDDVKLIVEGERKFYLVKKHS